MMSSHTPAPNTGLKLELKTVLRIFGSDVERESSLVHLFINRYRTFSERDVSVHCWFALRT